MAVARKPRVDEKGRKSRQIGPNIVRAWFDSVINPLLRALETERELLQKRNWTWRFRPAGLELIRPARVYVEPEARDNLKQFAALNPDCGRAIDSHDAKVHALLEECTKLHEATVRDESFRALCARVTSAESLSGLNVADLSELFGAYPPEDHLNILAQYVTNNTGELGSYYVSAKLWNRYRTEFLGLRDRPNVRSHYKLTSEAGESLLREVNRLIQLLEEKRLALSLEYDQPYVAVTRPAGLSERSL